MDGLPWDGCELPTPADQAAVWLFNSLAPGGANMGSAPGDQLLTAGALVLVAVGAAGSVLVRR
eukprot:10809928-Alexandrium_andersonii.AAC.1